MREGPLFRKNIFKHRKKPSLIITGETNQLTEVQ